MRHFSSLYRIVLSSVKIHVLNTQKQKVFPCVGHFYNCGSARSTELRFFFQVGYVFFIFQNPVWKNLPFYCFFLWRKILLFFIYKKSENGILGRGILSLSVIFRWRYFRHPRSFGNTAICIRQYFRAR